MEQLGRKVRLFMKKNRLLKALVPIVDKSGIPNWIYSFERSARFRALWEEHKSDFAVVEAMLADDFSRETYRAVIEGRMKNRKKPMKRVMVFPQYFQTDILRPVENEVFVDGGAYVGDTIEDFIHKFMGGSTGWKKIYAWEPDPANRAKLTELRKQYESIEIVPRGLWEERTTLRFSSGEESCSKVRSDGDISIEVDSIDNVCSAEKVTFIKMDIEGSEQQALRGAETIIKRDKPRLAICIYHKPEDLYEIPLMIKEMVPEYRLYIRHHGNSWAETVLYAVI